MIQKAQRLGREGMQNLAKLVLFERLAPQLRPRVMEEGFWKQMSLERHDLQTAAKTGTSTNHPKACAEVQDFSPKPHSMEFNLSEPESTQRAETCPLL